MDYAAISHIMRSFIEDDHLLIIFKLNQSFYLDPINVIFVTAAFLRYIEGRRHEYNVYHMVVMMSEWFVYLILSPSPQPQTETAFREIRRL